MFSRAYRDDDDLARLGDLVHAVVLTERERSYFLPSDLLWWRYQNLQFEPRQRVRLWKDDQQRLIAFGWVDPGLFTWQLHPQVGQHDTLADAVIAWCEECWRELSTDQQRASLSCHAFDDDPWRQCVLQRHGYRRDDTVLVHLHQSLDRPLPGAAWPVRPLTGEGEYDARVALHREVWHPSKVTAAAYRRMRQVAG